MSNHQMKQRGRSLRVEGLESRKLLAGDVLVELVEGNLWVTGDAMPNDFSVRRGPDPGQVIVAGRDSTAINGEASVTLSDVTGHVLIRTGPGDDTILVHDLSVPDRLRIDSGPGDDRVGLHKVAARQLSIDTGLGDDTLQWSDVHAGQAMLLTGPGSDRVEIRKSSVRGPLSIETGAGDDQLVIRESTLRGPSRLLGGHGRDSLVLGTDNIFHRRLFASFERTVAPDPEVPDAMAADIAAAFV